MTKIGESRRASCTRRSYTLRAVEWNECSLKIIWNNVVFLFVEMVNGFDKGEIEWDRYWWSEMVSCMHYRGEMTIYSIERHSALFFGVLFSKIYFCIQILVIYKLKALKASFTIIYCSLFMLYIWCWCLLLMCRWSVDQESRSM